MKRGAALAQRYLRLGPLERDLILGDGIIVQRIVNRENTRQRQ